ncbi:class I SAM-dependent methyltransferase [Aurantiacibacter sp. D1-12]|uniref:class I SAM-dependent methyltransferase n=1 Tax=Aurantiacibacter sp. D1-12 TaxID=2993658 RepID=UPI00237D2D82|nr:class I SAM-dependent methyltransferase [Aurantiacibacter sp. D1-12]MDE1466891.1 class I SAM-dependent methyltransferase [Aurantiacibacter sp. D1-12]
MANTIFDMLKAIGQASDDTRELFASGTRDVADLPVWKDRLSGVIFVDDHYVGQEEYASGSYRDSDFYTGRVDFERVSDCQRRVSSYQQFYVGKAIADFGCGAGDFLRAVRDNCASVVGIELQEDYVANMRENGIDCVRDLDDIDDNSLDVIFSFHAIEHLPDPVAIITALKQKLRPGGRMILEVPHAGDLLLRQDLDCEEFRKFTLWSQHLVLHTRASFEALLLHCGMQDVIVEGVQRYPLSNHLQWLAKGKPGGHRSQLTAMESPVLLDAYANALRKIDATDTITAIASVPA